MARKGASAEFLRKLRKKYKLGEYSRKKGSGRVSARRSYSGKKTKTKRRKSASKSGKLGFW